MADNETDKFREADASREDLAKRYDGAVPATSLPTTWRDGDGHTHLLGKPTQVLQPSARDIAALGRGQECCGHCKYFDLESGRREIIRQRFGEKLVREHEWKLRHLGAPVEALALCGASGGQTLVAFVSKSCDQFRPRGR